MLSSNYILPVIYKNAALRHKSGETFENQLNFRQPFQWFPHLSELTTTLSIEAQNLFTIEIGQITSRQTYKDHGSERIHVEIQNSNTHKVLILSMRTK
jgi:hypothetical protein